MASVGNCVVIPPTSRVGDGIAPFGSVGKAVDDTRLLRSSVAPFVIGAREPSEVVRALAMPGKAVVTEGTALIGTKEPVIDMGGTDSGTIELTRVLPLGATTTARLARRTTVLIPGVVLPSGEP